MSALTSLVGTTISFGAAFLPGNGREHDQAPDATIALLFVAHRRDIGTRTGAIARQIQHAVGKIVPALSRRRKDRLFHGRQ